MIAAVCALINIHRKSAAGYLITQFKIDEVVFCGKIPNAV